MILRLILKDLKANYSSIFLRSFLFSLIAGSVFVYRYYHWNVYMMYGYLTFAFASSNYLFIESKHANEVKTLTLPVNRASIVIAKYLTTIFIAILGLSLWILNAWFSEYLFPDAKSEFQPIFKFKVIFMAFVFVAIHLSIFLPSAFRFRTFGMIFTFVIALFLAVASIPVLFYPYKSYYNPYFESEDLMMVLMLTLFIILAPVISAALSVALYRTKEL
ncbi:ABC-2 transporter permease [candidate division KSB1 bacterium]|nr:ABC-2 transporter permease [candidate division KSB1 bacterium]